MSILIDALYINGGGGKVLLDYLISELEKTDKKVFYLIDERITGEIQPIKQSNTLHYLKAGLQSRKNFYRRHKELFSTVLCFGNLAPEIRLKAKVYTYFHQTLYLTIPENFTLKSKILYQLKILVLKNFIKNTDSWLVQSDLVKKQFEKKYKVSNVQVLPFYPPLNEDRITKRVKNTFLYVSNANPHKNHKNLIEAFCKFFDQNQKGKLVLTVSNNHSEIYGLIDQKISQCYPIENIGFVKRESLSRIYHEAEFLVFPSLVESFGLGLAEAIECGCKIIGADLPYTYAVCEPSLTFDPLSEDSIADAFSLSLQNNIKQSQSKVSNRIDQLISLLK